MSFNIGLSGLRAASKDLNVTGNNIANAGTVGFKQSRAEFADVYSATVLGTGKTQHGSGVLLANVSQLFNQGNVNHTQNPLDLAINGNGFFQVSNNGAHSYTRAGFFELDNRGYIVDNYGYNLQGYTVTPDGELEVGKVGNLRIETSMDNPKATGDIEQSYNLNAAEPLIDPTVTPFDPNDPASYTSATTTAIYDDQGGQHSLTQYFVKTGSNKWDMHILINGLNPDPAQGATPVTYPLEFDASGNLLTPAGGLLSVTNWTPATPDPANPTGPGIRNGAAGANGGLPSDIEIDMSGSTQFASAFTINKAIQNGYTIGKLAGIEIDDSGKIVARYTNNQTRVQGQVVLADFANVQGLQPVGKTQWVETQSSGGPVLNPGTVGTMGAIQGSALEDSNVELSDQLVNLIVAQRNYQANAKTIETQSAITQTIINLR